MRHTTFLALFLSACALVPSAEAVKCPRSPEELTRLCHQTCQTADKDQYVAKTYEACEKCCPPPVGSAKTRKEVTK